jgi:hypothetical protein
MPGAVPHLGGATSVAAYDARFLAVGAGVESPEVQEPAGAFGVEVRLDGTTRWAGRGLPAPRHGAITMAASLADGFLVGATDVAGMRLATAPAADGPWAPVPPPPVGPAAPVAAATLDGFTVLAVVDGDARTSWWRHEPRGWTEVPPVAGVDPSVTVRAVVGSARGTAVAGVAGHDHVFREVAA